MTWARTPHGTKLPLYLERCASSIIIVFFVSVRMADGQAHPNSAAQAPQLAGVSELVETMRKLNSQAEQAKEAVDRLMGSDAQSWDYDTLVDIVLDSQVWRRGIRLLLRVADPLGSEAERKVLCTENWPQISGPFQKSCFPEEKLSDMGRSVGGCWSGLQTIPR